MSVGGTTTITGGWSGVSGSSIWSELQWSATQSEANNTTTITANLYFKQTSSYPAYTDRKNCTFSITIDGVTKTESTVHVQVANKTSQLLLSYSRTINHASDGTKSFTISASSSSVGSLRNLTGLSKNYTLPAIPRSGSIETITGNTIGSPVTVQVTSSSSLTYKYSVKFPTTSVTQIPFTTATLTNGSFSFTPGTEWSEQIPNSASATAYLYLDTYSGSTKIGSTSKSFTLQVPSSVTPNIVAVFVEEANPIVSAVTTNNYIQTLSKLKISVSAIGEKGSTIKSYRITANGQTFTSTPAFTDILASSGTNKSIQVVVTDSRNRTTTNILYYNVLAYTAPILTSLKANRRLPPNSSKIDVVVKGTWNILGGINNQASFNLKENGTSVHTSVGTSGSLNSTITRSGISDTTSVSYIFTITDRFNKSASAIVEVGTAVQALTIRPDVGIGVGKVHESGALDVAGATNISGTLSVGNINSTGSIISSGNISSSGDIYAYGKQIPYRTLGSGALWTFPGGLKICYFTIDLTYQSSSTLSGTWVYPSSAAFTSNPAVTVSLIRIHPGSPDPGYALMSKMTAPYLYQTTLTQATIFCSAITGQTFSSGDKVTAQVVAFGN